MGTETVHSARGSTAAGPPGEPERPRHLLGSSLRAVGVFLDTAFRVVVLGTDGTRQPDAGPAVPRQDARLTHR